MSKYIFVDVESDGPCPGIFNMVCFGAVVLDTHEGLGQTFYGKTAPLTGKWYPESLAISGFTRTQHEGFPDPEIAIKSFYDWVIAEGGDKPKFVSDCLTGDWAYIDYYFHKYIGKNPFGYSGRRMSDIICGMEMNMKTKWKKLKTQMDIHDPVFDAIENAKVFQKLIDEGLKA